MIKQIYYALKRDLNSMICNIGHEPKYKISIVVEG